MEAPSFDYSNITPEPQQPQPDAAPAGGPVQPNVIESASASTACQTSSSKFAYILTGSVLGVIILLAVAVTLLVFSVLQVGLDASSGHYYDYGYSDQYYYDYQDELDQFEEDLWNDLEENHNFEDMAYDLVA